jgi:hypothetical protein
MPVDLSQILRDALRDLESEKDRIERQLAAIRQAITQASRSTSRTGTIGRRRRMSGAARRAVSRRMKAYWTKRRAAESTAKSKAARRRK